MELWCTEPFLLRCIEELKNKVGFDLSFRSLSGNKIKALVLDGKKKVIEKNFVNLIEATEWVVYSYNLKQSKSFIKSRGVPSAGTVMTGLGSQDGEEGKKKSIEWYTNYVCDIMSSFEEFSFDDAQEVLYLFQALRKEGVTKGEREVIIDEAIQKFGANIIKEKSKSIKRKMSIFSDHLQKKRKMV